VINLAARAGVRYSVENPWIFVETNVIGTLNMLELCRQSGTKKFIFASTSSIYGANPPYPTPESASSSGTASTLRGQQKRRGSPVSFLPLFVWSGYQRASLFTVYGPAGRPTWPYSVLCNGSVRGGRCMSMAMANSHAVSPILMISPAASSLALKPVGYEIVNLGGHEVITINALVRLIEELMG